MTEAQVLALIQQFIVANGNNEITANVLRPILEAMLAQPNDEIGDLSQLETSDQSNLVAAINEIITSSGISDGLNITEVFRAFVSGEGTFSDQVAASINTGASFNIPAGHLGVVSFIQWQGTPFDSGFIKQSFYLKTGAGTYGSGGTALTASDLFQVAPRFVEVETDYYFQLGDIGTTEIEDFVNGSGPYSITGLAVFEATQGGVEKAWLFTGGDGNWGDGATAVTADMFVDLDSQDPIPAPTVNYLPVKVITTTPYTIVADDINRPLLFTSNTQVVNIPNGLPLTDAASGITSFWFRGIFTGTGTHTVNHPNTGVWTGGVGSYIMAECYDTSGDGSWIVKQWSQLLDVATDSYVGRRLKPARTDSNGFLVDRSSNTRNGFEAVNVNTGDFATTSFVARGAADLYTKLISMQWFGSGYNQTYLRDKGALYSTDTIFHLSANATGSHEFRTGASFGAQTKKFKVWYNGAIEIFRATLASITNAAAGFIVGNSSDSNRPNYHNGTEWKGLAYVDEIPEASVVDYEALFDSEIDF